MDKLILCLANSYKHGGRCIAGIEVSLKEGRISIKKSSYGIPIWKALKKVPHFKLHSLFLNFNSCPRSISSFKSGILFWTGI